MAENSNRYRIDAFHSKALHGNPLNSIADRDMNIYLPPDYNEMEGKRYPVIYFLHGYGGNNRSWTVTSRTSKDRDIPWELIPKKYLKQMDVDRLPTFEMLDELINQRELEPFILVQPDGSLHAPCIDNRKDLKGQIAQKGSFYINSPYSGKYMDYIINDIIEYVDSNYRTIPDKQHRALIGGSMGGFGAIYLSVLHPEKFIAAASLSPGNLGNLELLNWKLRVPIIEQIFGSKLDAKLGDSTMEDILDTCDLIFSNDNRLIPSLKKNENGEIIQMDQKARENWIKYDLNHVIQENPDSLKNVHLLLNCEQNDEFGLTGSTKKIHETLSGLGTSHEFEIYSDPKAALTPHGLGIGYHILPSIQFCLRHFPVK